MKQFKTLALASALLLLVSLAASAQTYDAVKDFSLASNPNGVWSYGYLTTPGAPLTLYTWSDNQCNPGMSWWGLYLGPCDAMPVLGHNDTDKVFCWATNCLPPAYILPQPGWNGELSVVRWTAPSAGTYGVQGAVMGVDCYFPTSTDLRVMRNSNQELFRTAVNSCDSPLSFKYRVPFSAGDTLDFVVDWGQDANPYGDGTGIQFKVTKID
jgi:hypothetical protein